METTDSIDRLIKTSWLNIASLYNQLAQNHGFSRATGLALFNIDDNKGTAATKIAPIMGMKNTSLSRLLKRMEVDGLIIRVPNKKDKRSVNIKLSKKGKERKKVVKKLIKDYNDYINSHFSKKDMDCFVKTINEITRLTNSYKTLKNVSE